ncbi:MAG TPA: TonB-dependent receptor, partial [Cyclobacteriaceae bacterium]
LSGAVQLSAKWGLGVNVTRSVNRNQDFAYDPSDVTRKKNTAIILSPDWISGSQLTWSVFKNFQATWLSKYVSKQYLDNTQNNNLKLDPYFINDLRFSYHIYPKSIKDIGISFLLNNIFDVKYSSNGAVYGATPYYYPQAGRNFMTMFTLKF